MIGRKIHKNVLRQKKKLFKKYTKKYTNKILKTKFMYNLIISCIDKIFRVLNKYKILKDT